MRLKPCLSAIEFTTRRNHGRLSDSVPSRSNIASLYLGMIRIALSFCPSVNLSVGPRSHALGVGAHMIKRHASSTRTSATFFHPACRNLTSASAFLNRSNYGGENGTRTSTLAAWRAYTRDPFVVAVLRPLTSGTIAFCANQAPPKLGGA